MSSCEGAEKRDAHGCLVVTSCDDRRSLIQQLPSNIHKQPSSHQDRLQVNDATGCTAGIHKFKCSH